MRCNIPARDLTQKLDGTVCMYKRKPVYVRVEGHSLLITPLPARDAFERIKADDPEFDISNPPLGYMQVDTEGVAYVTRIPVRRSIQGLNTRSMHFHSLPQSQKDVYRRVREHDVIFTQPFVDMILNSFPPLDNCLKKIRGLHSRNSDQTYETVVSRDIALKIQEVTGVINVYFKNDIVGWIPPNEYVVEVPSNEKGWIVSKYLSNVLGWQIN